MKKKLKQKRFQTNRKSFILMTVLCMGVGFAFLSSNLTITGNTSVSGNKWNVYFTNVQVTDGSVDASVVPTTSGTNTTSIDYTVTLDKPGDFYEFTVDAVNNGTIDAMIQNIIMTSLDIDVAKYLSYTATYLDGTELTQNDVLEADDSTTYKVRVEFKKNIEASDLSEEDKNLNLTFGVNYVQSTVKKPKTFTQLVKSNVLSDSSIDFTNMSSASNGRGLYVMHDTMEDDFPIYYYRGNVSNNNARFAGFCWKIVRTTETGGTKLVYNGVPRNIYSTKLKMDSNEYKNVENSGTYPYVYNSDSKEWTSTPTGDVQEMEIKFSIEEAGDYFLNYNLLSESFGLFGELYKNQDRIGDFYGDDSGTIEMYGLTPEDEIKITYSRWGESSANDSFSFNIEKGVNGVMGCDNTGNLAQLSSGSNFSLNKNSPAYNGYMYGTVYTNGYSSNDSSYSYGNTFTYENGVYTLKDIHTGVDATHHYTCLSSGTTCSSVKYVYYTGASSAYYITLTGGKDIETALAEMQANTTNSVVKTTVDNWFSNTFATYFTTNNKDYNDYLEDTVWCNDRSMNILDVSLNSWYGTSAVNNGFKPNGGSTNNRLIYSSFGRMIAGTPRLDCPNKNDSFTVAESATGNGNLTYPVGLLTADEMVLAGGQDYNNVSQSNTDFYLYTNQSWYSMSPSDFSTEIFVYAVSSPGGLGSSIVSGDTLGVRPSISLKSDVKIAAGGDGTVVSPYEFVVE